MQIRYLALLRGINVGGKAIIKMSDLKAALGQAGMQDVTTYIQSGNVFVTCNETNKATVATAIARALKNAFNLDVAVAVFTRDEWQAVIDTAPEWWGHKPEWKHNLLVFVEPVQIDDALAAIGTLKPDIEAIEPGPGVLYQGMSLKLYGRTTTGKLASSLIYKKLTIRNYNTSTKLLTLF
jgi:uncharacterized protein (DUF1697 family)